MLYSRAWAYKGKRGHTSKSTQRFGLSEPRTARGSHKPLQHIQMPMSWYGFPTSQPEGIGSFPVPVISTLGERDFGTLDESPAIIRAPQQATKAARETANNWPVVNCRSRSPRCSTQVRGEGRSSRLRCNGLHLSGARIPNVPDSRSNQIILSRMPVRTIQP